MKELINQLRQWMALKDDWFREAVIHVTFDFVEIDLRRRSLKQVPPRLFSVVKIVDPEFRKYVIEEAIQRIEAKVS